MSKLEKSKNRRNIGEEDLNDDEIIDEAFIKLQRILKILQIKKQDYIYIQIQ